MIYENQHFKKRLDRISTLENVVLFSMLGGALCFPLFYTDTYSTVLLLLFPYLLGALLHHFLFLPHFLFKGHFLVYLFLLLLMLFGVTILSDTITQLSNRTIALTNFGNPQMLSFNISFAEVSVIMFLISALDLGIRMIFRNIRQRMIIQESEMQFVQKKMEFLTFQISPHFLMNTLNNIHALVDLDTDKAKDAIVSLSRILRFMLYESAPGTMISIDRQIEILRDYCALHLLRYGKNVKVSINIPKELPHIQLPPLLVIVFVENAFKHGVAYGKETSINVNIWTEPSKYHFTISNSLVLDKKKDAVGGVGIKNVKERLQMLYGDSYSLVMEERKEVNEFFVHLTLPI